jgi:hypothetical protein
VTRRPQGTISVWVSSCDELTGRRFRELGKRPIILHKLSYCSEPEALYIKAAD